MKLFICNLELRQRMDGGLNREILVGRGVLKRPPCVVVIPQTINYFTTTPRGHTWIYNGIWKKDYLKTKLGSRSIAARILL